MTVRPIPTDLLPWAMAALPETEGWKGPSPAAGSLTVVAGDASNRRYFRLQLAHASYIVAEAPPATEKNEAFVVVRNILGRAGVTVPRIHAVDYERGYLLLEDLGDGSLLSALSDATVDGHYRRAFAALHKMAAIDSTGLTMGAYDHELLSEELSRFPVWFVEKLLGYSPDEREWQLIARFNTALITSALEQPTVLVHRDFHSRNLMLQPSGELAVIDFQDAVIGPVTYDLVSLLRDCYIHWPAPRVQQWALAYRNELGDEGGMADIDEACFLRWFDWKGLQRHIKVLGTFARLYLRDNKPGYVDDLPLVIAYVEQILQKYAAQEPVFAEFYQWFQERLSPMIAAQPWSGDVSGETA